ncbi:hypothetical protein M2138_001596 [Dysgonomonadaceae bacterium PH5-43]|nr:hypothetical protein [Dysgonomonadaceae bacterium PH5-43]
MKKRLLFFVICFMAITFGQDLLAQSELPKTSTKTDPVWYYIKVKGSIASRQNRLFTASSDNVVGSYMDNVTPTNRNNYLWRFEKNGDVINIVSKQNNLLLTISDKSELTTAANSNVTWEIIPSASVTKQGYFQIKSNTGKYATQGSATVEYVVQAAATGGTDNSLFSFLRFDDSEPQVSTNTDIWYYIKSAETGQRDKYITDVNASTTDIVKFKVLTKETDDEKLCYQQWKVIKPTDTSSTMHFVNRATGNVIKTAYDYNSYFNVQSATEVGESNGWKLSFINLDQFAISGLDAQGITGYLNSSSTLKPATAIPLDVEFLNSSYAWRFVEIETDTHINKNISNPFENVDIRVEDRRVIVEGANDYSVYHISGFQVGKDIQLPVGVYLIVINGSTKSILVK